MPQTDICRLIKTRARAKASIRRLRKHFAQELEEAARARQGSANALYLEPVFQAMLENATRICEADLGTMALYEDGGFRHVALDGAPPVRPPSPG